MDYRSDSRCSPKSNPISRSGSRSVGAIEKSGDISLWKDAGLVVNGVEATTWRVDKRRLRCDPEIFYALAAIDRMNARPADGSIQHHALAYPQ
jgi:hypothetical protein